MEAAIPEVADLGAMALVLVAIVVVWHLREFAQLLTALLRFLPLVGGWIADHLADHVVDALNDVLGWLTNAFGALVGLLWRGLQLVWQLFEDVINLGVDVYAAMWHVVFHYIPLYVQVAIDTAQQLYALSRDLALSLYHQAVDYTAAAVGTLGAELRARLDIITSWAQAAITAVDNTAHALVASVVTWAVGSFAAVYARIDAAAAVVTDYVRAEVSLLTGWVESEFAAIRTWVTGEIITVEREAEALYQDAVRAAEASAAAAEAAALAEVAIVARTFDTFWRDCGKNLCGGLNVFSQLLQGLETLVEGGAIIALAAAAVADGPGLAHEIVDTIGGVVEDAAAGVRDAVGLAA